MAKKSKREKAPRPKFERHYSGDASECFWKHVNALKGSAHDQAYSLGIVLQDLEGRILGLIEHAERWAEYDNADQ